VVGGDNNKGVGKTMVIQNVGGGEVENWGGGQHGNHKNRKGGQKKKKRKKNKKPGEKPREKKGHTWGFLKTLKVKGDTVPPQGKRTSKVGHTRGVGTVPTRFRKTKPTQTPTRQKKKKGAKKTHNPWFKKGDRAIVGGLTPKKKGRHDGTGDPKNPQENPNQGSRQPRREGHPLWRKRPKKKWKRGVRGFAKKKRKAY